MFHHVSHVNVNDDLDRYDAYFEFAFYARTSVRICELHIFNIYLKLSFFKLCENKMEYLFFLCLKKIFPEVNFMCEFYLILYYQKKEIYNENTSEPSYSLYSFM